MTLAEQKQHQNIAEYVLFMWQMEDLVRAVQFDTEQLESFIRSYTPGEEEYQGEKQWFTDLVRKMRSERVEHRGHIGEIHELLFELNYLHNTLLNIIKDKTYLELHRIASANIQEYLERTGGKGTNDIEVCLTALYGLLVLRLKKEVVSTETEEAMQTFSNLLARLASQYKLMKLGEKNYSLN
jgi:hypothetical protein